MEWVQTKSLADHGRLGHRAMKQNSTAEALAKIDELNRQDPKIAKKTQRRKREN
jgi:hypothetical protein